MTSVSARDTALAERVSALLDETMESVRHKDVQSTTLERLHLTWEADRIVQGLPQPLQLGHGLAYLLEHISTPVTPHDILLGRMSETSPNEEEEAFFQEALRAWRGRAIPPWMQDGGHECLAWDRLLRHGLAGLEEMARQRAAQETGSRTDFLSGAVLVYQALRSYLRRYAHAAEQAGLADAAARCRALAERPPRSFAEAIQLMWIVGHVYCTMVAVNPTLTFGRMDELLLGYYRRDVAAGVLTREEAAALITDFYCKNNLILGRGEHQMSEGSAKSTGWQRNLTYDAPQYIVLGGRRADGSEPGNELTELWLECVAPRFENPVVVLRYTPDLGQSLWELALDKMRQNASLLIYNDQAVIPALERAGIAPRDALTYTMHGCNWVDVPGIQRTAAYPFLWLPRFVLQALLGAPDAPAPDYQDMDQIYERVGRAYRAALEGECTRYRDSRARWEETAPGVLQVDDCFLAGPIERARSWSMGGVPYGTLTATLSGIATAADSLAAVDELVFRSRRFSLDALRDALQRNYGAPLPAESAADGTGANCSRPAGRCEAAADDDARALATLRLACLNTSKFGQDDDHADRHAVRVVETALHEVERARRRGTPDEIIILPCVETDMNHRRAGAESGATPDGRLAGEPLSENLSPSPGSCTHGLTAMLRSLAKLPLDHMTSGALNIRLSPRMASGEEGLRRLGALLRAYLDMGGLQVQLSFADVQTLRQAQATPEAYRDLMVRITGYSAVFVDMDGPAQEEIIRRTEMGF
jgi:pyruvate-formate lyase